MLAQIVITPWHWAGFIGVILILLALDLGVFNRKSRVMGFREALGWTSCWFTLSMIFAALLFRYRTAEEAKLFIAGYIVELSLSMDNVFVIALIFSYFRVPAKYQRRVLIWGILGALIMRGVMIGLGAALIHRFEWILYLLGAFLVVTGIKMLLNDEEGVEPERNPFIKAARRFFPVSDHFEEERFFTKIDGRRALTPLMLVLIMVETTDLVFAVDSIPAIFGLTQDPFIIFTSNVFAILGLRSLYFVLAGALRYFSYLKYGLSIILVFIGGKMLLKYFKVEIPPNIALSIVVSILVASIVLSFVMTRRDGKDAPPPEDAG